MLVALCAYVRFMALKSGLIWEIQYNFSRPFRDQTGADFEPFGEIGGF